MDDSLFPMDSNYKPLKAPNRIIDPEDYPWELGMVSSPKKDGNRGLCILGKLYTSSMKTPLNELLPKFLAPMLAYCEKHQIVLDFELYDPASSHHAKLSGIINSYSLPLPVSLRCYVFDGMPYEDFQVNSEYFPYRMRIPHYHEVVNAIDDERIIALPQRPVETPEEVDVMFNSDLANGDEGSIIRSLDIQGDVDEKRQLRGGWYKHSRATERQGIIFKQKLFKTDDGIITRVVQRRQLKKEWPRTYDNNGQLEKVHNKDAYELTKCVGSFEIKGPCSNCKGEPLGERDGKPVHICTSCDSTGTMVFRIAFGVGYPMEDRRRLWSLRNGLLGKHAEYIHMPHGAKSRARIGRFVKLRPDKD